MEFVSTISEPFYYCDSESLALHNLTMIIILANGDFNDFHEHNVHSIAAVYSGGELNGACIFVWSTAC